MRACHGGTSAPDYIDPVRGWRTWLVVQGHDGARLASVSFPALWPRGKRLSAECGRGFHTGAGPPLRIEHRAPSLDCSCGIYASRSLDESERPRPAWPPPCVVGTVALWGRGIEHEIGWRGQFAYPARLGLVCSVGS